MAFRCKFAVQSVTKESGDRILVLKASDQRTGDNKDWSKSTPSGEVRIHVTNPEAFITLDALVPGDFYWVDLTPATV